jgi:hypothetical protein
MGLLGQENNKNSEDKESLPKWKRDEIRALSTLRTVKRLNHPTHLHYSTLPLVEEGNLP